ncbi:MAG: histone-like protein [Promethearchaeota archaeon]
MAKKKAAKAKAPAKSFIAKAPIRRLMKAEGAELVSNEAVQLLIDQLLKVAADVTKAAVSAVKADKRKRVTAGDIRDAAK